jgi:hypothetical protein
LPPEVAPAFKVMTHLQGFIVRTIGPAILHNLKKRKCLCRNGFDRIASGSWRPVWFCIIETAWLAQARQHCRQLIDRGFPPFGGPGAQDWL